MPWGTVADFFSDFFGVVPGVFPGGLGIVERYSCEVLSFFGTLFFGLVQKYLPVFFQDSRIVFEHIFLRK